MGVRRLLGRQVTISARNKEKIENGGGALVAAIAACGSQPLLLIFLL
jgi:hypothetical protein